MWAYDNDTSIVVYISVFFPDLTALIPRNTYRSYCSELIPLGKKIEVTGEEDYMRNLVSFVESGKRVPVYVTLRPITQVRP